MLTYEQRILLLWQKNCLDHHLVGIGRTFHSGAVRAAILVRANCLSKGYSGIRPEFVVLMLELLRHDILPEVPLRGTVSASGDLLPLTYIAQALTGMKTLQVKVKGELKLCPDALQDAGLQPLTPNPREALALVNSTSFSAGLAACVLYKANTAVVLVQVCTALAVEALAGKIETFNPLIHECLAHPGNKEVAKNIREMLKESRFVVQQLDMDLQDSGEGNLKQDRYSLRTSPQWLGATLETLEESCRRVTTELNSVVDNPLIDHCTGVILQCGNFQGLSLSVAMDQSRQALQICGKILAAHSAELVDHSKNRGLTPNLCGSNFRTDHGLKGADIAMTSYMCELDLLANPVTNHVYSAELGNQNVNSLALISARKTEEALEILQMMLANQLFLTVQAIDLRALSRQVNNKLSDIFHPDTSATITQRYGQWYDFVFNTENTAKKVSSILGSDMKSDFEENLVNEMEQLLEGIQQGTAGAADNLGEGTRLVYQFIRLTLAVPFYTGEQRPDEQLGTILNAIKHGQVEDLLKQVFKSS